MLYELRQYRIKKGKITQWMRLMEEIIDPFQVSRGMVVCGSFTAEEDDTLCACMRRFTNEGERKRLYAQVYGGAHWEKLLRGWPLSGAREYLSLPEVSAMSPPLRIALSLLLFAAAQAATAHNLVKASSEPNELGRTHPY